MRTVFVSDRVDELAMVHAELERQAQIRLPGPAARQTRQGRSPEDWAIVGEPERVRDQIANYRERLGMTHLIATRLGVGRIEPKPLERSLELLPEIASNL